MKCPICAQEVEQLFSTIRGRMCRACKSNTPKQHDHSCHCGTADVTPHKINTRGCVRFMTAAPEPMDDLHAELNAVDRWCVDGQEITGYTMRDQRGYFQHPCGCWSRHEGSTNSIDA